VNTQQAMSLLRCQFPDFEDHSAESTRLWGSNTERLVDVYDFAVFVTGLYEQSDDVLLRSAFSVVEQFLLAGTAEVRDWASAWLEAMQNIASWRRYGPGAFTRVLGRETYAIWDGMEAIRTASWELDLADCSVFEAEIITWRFTREKARGLATTA
jgi:hypothetical protein